MQVGDNSRFGCFFSRDKNLEGAPAVPLPGEYGWVIVKTNE